MLARARVEMRVPVAGDVARPMHRKKKTARKKEKPVMSLKACDVEIPWMLVSHPYR